MGTRSRTTTAWVPPACLGTLGAAVLALRVMGRPWWCKGGEAWLWSGDVWSMHNSQHLVDPYVFTHVTHGVVLYALVRLVGRRWSLATRFMAVLVLESAWEVFENTDLVIERYRAVTMSLDYYGDSIANALADVAACMVGFLAAAWLPGRVAAGGVLLLEAALALWIRDGLLLNVVMLVHPIDAIRAWQAAGGAP